MAILKSLKGLLEASTDYDSVPAYFVDSVLNGFAYLPMQPPPPNPDDDLQQDLGWHARLAKTVQYFLQTTLYPDSNGRPNPGQSIIVHQVFSIS